MLLPCSVACFEHLFHLFDPSFGSFGFLVQGGKVGPIYSTRGLTIDITIATTLAKLKWLDVPPLFIFLQSFVGYISQAVELLQEYFLHKAHPPPVALLVSPPCVALPAAVGVQVAHPKKLVVDIAGEASILMTMQEISTAVQYNLPIKIFILNNQYMGMVRQWQELHHEKNYSESYSKALPDFVKLAEAYGCVGIKAEKPDELDEKIKEMINIDRPVIFDCHVDQDENCFPMIPSGKPHNQMLLGPKDQEENKITGKGKALV